MQSLSVSREHCVISTARSFKTSSTCTQTCVSRSWNLKFLTRSYQFIKNWVERYQNEECSSVKYLAWGSSQISMSFSYRVAPSTVNSIVMSTFEAIWEELSKTELPQPTEEMWEKKAEEFYSLWKFPNCIGAIDGKHVEIQAPKNSGSLFFNYKKTFSVVLLELVDANYKFVIIDVGGYGKSSDGGLFSKSNLGKSLEANSLNIPNPSNLPNSEEPLPYIIVGDEAFPLKRYLLRPYPGSSARSDESKRIFNYRVSRARRVVENAFGILTQRFRIFYGRIQLSPENADKVMMAACVLHNYLRNDITVGDFESEANLELNNLTSFRRLGGNLSEEASSVRDKYREYFSNVGSVPWQLEVVRRGRTTVDD